ncbi:mucin-like protein 3, partial [Pteropus medius]|uniref:mucin-like protein 3 n=1 Tax=Pteropus vampyrus TaxID=132908 RepID=UPI00196ACCA8
MAQLAHCIRSTFGLHCCLLFLLASREAGATAFQEFHKIGESPKSGHLSAPTPGSVYSTPSDHTGLRLGHSSMDHIKSAETYRPKHHCKSTHHSKQIHKSIGNSKNSVTHHEAPPTSEQTPGNQEKGPLIWDKRSIHPTDSINTLKKSSDTKYPTTKSKSKITCPKSKTSRQTVTRNSNKSVTPLGNTVIILDSKSTTSCKTTTLSHNSVNSDINKKLTSSSEKSTTFTNISYKATRSIEMTERINNHTIATNYKTTVVSDKTQTKARKQTPEMPTGAEKHTQTPEKPTFNKKESTSAIMMVTRTVEMPTKYGKRSTSAHVKMTSASGMPTNHQQQSTLVHEKMTRALSMPTERGQQGTLDHEKNTSAPAISTKHIQHSTSAHEKITRVPAMTTEHELPSTSTHEMITKTPETPAEHGQQSSISAHERITKTPAMPTEHTSAEEI